MKKAILTVLTALMLIIPAYATEGDTAMDQPIQQEPVVVATLEELQAAIDAAEDGDTLYLSKRIPLNNISLSCDKDITIRGTGPNSCFFSVSGDCALSGFNFITDYRDLSIAIIDNTGLVGNVKISDCQFTGNGNDFTYLVNIFSGNVEFQNCIFQSSAHTAMNISTNSTVVIKDCFFGGTQTLYIGGAICNYGDLEVYNTEITNNASGIGGAIYNAGSLTISSSKIKGNTGKNEFDVIEGNDIYSCGVLTITDEQSEDAGFYEETTGEKLSLPLVDYTDTARLTYLTDEQATEYFAPEPPQEEESTPPEPGDNGDGDDTPTEQPQQPGEQTEDGDTTGGEQPPKDDPAEPPTEPEQPPEGEGKDNPTENPPESTEQPVEPPQDDTTGDTSTTTPNTPQQPQEPADGDNGNNDNYTPPTDYRPSQRPVWPVVTIKPTEDSKPQEQPDSTPAPAKPQLVCNEAVIDTSRTVVLLGYGDGLLHENDPLTRAQLATIIYRLLDDESIAKYSNAELAFVDVAADAWYAPFVQTINGAGIVQGVGGGKYSPESHVTWSQIVTILTRFVEPQEYPLQHIQYQGWAQEAIQTAVANGWIADRADFTPDAIISRGQLEQLINSVLALYR